MSIVKECMLVNLQIGVWRGYKLDKAKTHEVTSEADAAPDAARVNKHLVSSAALSDITAIVTQLRHQFHAKTLPWKDNGDRILTRVIYMPFIEEHEGLVTKFNAAKQDFLEEKYPAAMEQASFRMGEMFDPNDYPTVAQLAHKFYVNLDIDGIPTAYDFRLKDNEAAMQARVTKAMNGLWQKLAEPLEHFAERMEAEELDGKSLKFQATTISNLREIVDILPMLNFTGDKNLEGMRVEIERQITRYEPEDLRKNKLVRQAVGAQARNIMDQMLPFMNAFGPVTMELEVA